MNIDEQFLEMSDKSILNDIKNGHVTIPTQLNIQKGQFLLPFFLPVL
jgi:hypothetical protein